VGGEQNSHYERADQDSGLKFIHLRSLKDIRSQRTFKQLWRYFANIVAQSSIRPIQTEVPEGVARKKANRAGSPI
jgi:hypothetical protein